MRTVIVVIVGLTLTACGAAASYSASSRGSAPSRPPALIKVVVDAHLGRILATGSGRTLYLFTPEKDGHVVCTGACAQTWLPLLISAGGAATSAAPLPGKLGSIRRPDGRLQATYNEFPLYTFSGDSAPGETRGQGLLGRWLVVPETFPEDADHDADGTTGPGPTPSAARTMRPAPAPTRAPVPVPVPVPAQNAAPTPCNFAQPNFNDVDGDNSGAPSDGDGCG